MSDIYFIYITFQKLAELSSVDCHFEEFFVIFFVRLVVIQNFSLISAFNTATLFYMPAFESVLCFPACFSLPYFKETASNMLATSWIVICLFSRTSFFFLFDSHIHLCYLSMQIDVLSVGHLQQRSHCPWCGKTTENWCSYSDLLSKTTLNICKFPLHFLQCKAKFSAGVLFFLNMQVSKFQLDNMLVCKNTLLNIHMCCSLTLSRK